MSGPAFHSPLKTDRRLDLVRHEVEYLVRTVLVIDIRVQHRELR